jgi:hypothetical protein
VTILKQLSATTQTDGTAVTAGPGNSNWSSLSTGSGNTHVFRDAAKMGSSAGYQMTSGGANATIAYLDLDADVNDFEFRIPFSWTGTITATTVIGRGYSDTAHVSDIWSFSLLTSGRIQFVEKITGGLNVTSPSTAGLTLAAGSQYMLIGQVDVSAGTISIDCYPLGGATKLFTLAGTLLGTAATRSFRWSIGIGTGGMTALNTSSAFALGTGGKLSRTDIANTPPSVTVAAFQNVAAAAAVTASVSATDEGSITSYAWTVVAASSTATPTLTNASTATVSFTAPAVGNLVTLQCVVTDDLGASTTVTTEVRVPTSGAFTTLAIGGTGAAWTNVGGAATGGAALADALDTTYVESPDYATTESERRWRLQPLTPRSALQLTNRNLVTATGGTKKFRLYEANTLREEWTVPQHTTVADDAFTLSSPGSISDWGGLWVAEAVAS